MALGQLAPGTISITAIAAPTTIRVARQVSQINESNAQQFLTFSTRSTLIIKQEKSGLTQFGLKLPANTMLSLPPSNEFHRV